MHFAQRYALLLPEAPANGKASSRPGSAASERSNGTGTGSALPLTPSGFIDWFAVTEGQVGDRADVQPGSLILWHIAPFVGAALEGV